MYDEAFQLQSSMKWTQAPATSLVYNPKRDELIVAGAEGVFIYKCVNAVPEGDDKLGGRAPSSSATTGSCCDWSSTTHTVYN